MLLGDWRESGFLFVPLLTALAGLASAQCPQNDGQVTGGLVQSSDLLHVGRRSGCEKSEGLLAG